MLYDDFVSSPSASLSGLFAFLGVDPAFPVDTTTRHNPAALPRSMPLNRILWKSVLWAQRFLPTRWRGSGMAASLLARTYRRAPEFPPVIRRRLSDRYRDDIRATAQLIGRDLSHWLT